MKSHSASAVEIWKVIFLATIILAGAIFIFIGVHAASRPPATESATRQAPSGPTSDARGNAGQAVKPKKQMHSGDVSNPTTLRQAARFGGKNVVPASGPNTRSFDTPGAFLILLVIGVFGYIWIHADRLLSEPKSDKIRINLMPRSINPEADCVLSSTTATRDKGAGKK
jgi:hypothetical protein